MFACGVSFLCGIVFYPVLKVLFDRLITKAKNED